MQTSVVTAKIKLLSSDEQMVTLAQVRTLYTKACNWLSAKVYGSRILDRAKLQQAYYDILSLVLKNVIWCITRITRNWCYELTPQGY